MGGACKCIRITAIMISFIIDIADILTDGIVMVMSWRDETCPYNSDNDIPKILISWAFVCGLVAFFMNCAIRIRKHCDLKDDFNTCQMVLNVFASWFACFEDGFMVAVWYSYADSCVIEHDFITDVGRAAIIISCIATFWRFFGLFSSCYRCCTLCESYESRCNDYVATLLESIPKMLLLPVIVVSILNIITLNEKWNH